MNLGSKYGLSMILVVFPTLRYGPHVGKKALGCERTQGTGVPQDRIRLLTYDGWNIHCSGWRCSVVHDKDVWAGGRDLVVGSGKRNYQNNVGEVTEACKLAVTQGWSKCEAWEINLAENFPKNESQPSPWGMVNYYFFEYLIFFLNWMLDIVHFASLGGENFCSPVNILELYFKRCSLNPSEMARSF